MKHPRIVFFGTPEYSIRVLEKLYSATYPIVLVVSKPTKPVGRNKTLTPSPVAIWAKKRELPLLTPESDPKHPWLYQQEKKVVSNILEYHPELLITADYTQKIPQSLVSQSKYGGLNIHPSLLPAYRGPAPIPWAILKGETETGISIVTLAEKFDQGKVVAQEKEPILATDTTDSLLTKLFTKGGELLVKLLPDYINNYPNSLLPTTNYKLPTSTYFPRLTREHGFEPWNKIKKAIESGLEASRIERKYRALHPWPGLWTKVKLADGSGQLAEKRLKILHCYLTANRELQTANLILDEVQLEGKKPVRGQPLKDLQSKLSDNI